VKSGNIPVFIDSQKFDFNMDLDKIESSINENTAAIIATSIFGYPVNLDQLMNLRRKYPHIKIIQDCAHSFRAEYKKRFVNNEGDAALFGLNISKLINSVFGGMVTTDDDNIALSLKKLRSKKVNVPALSKSIKRKLYFAATIPAFSLPIYGFVNLLERSHIIDQFIKYYDEKVIDMPKDFWEGMTNFEASIGIIQVTRYQDIVDKHRRAAIYYKYHLEGNSDLILPPMIDGATYSHYVIQTEKRENIIRRSLRQGVQLGCLIEYSIPEMEAYGSHSESEFPVASKFARTVLNLPLWGGVRIAQRVVKNLKFLKEKQNT